MEKREPGLVVMNTTSWLNFPSQTVTETDYNTTGMTYAVKVRAK